METGKEFLKNMILKTCPPRLQHKLRRSYLTRQVIKSRHFHELEVLLLKKFISAGDSVADVGANIGLYTKELSSLVAVSGQVYAFEPISENFDILDAVIRRAQLSNIRSFRAALGSLLGSKEMVIPHLSAFSGYYLAHFAQVGEFGRRQNVDVLTFDDLWKNGTIEVLDFIKCDVEGSELEVIRGGLGLIQTQWPGWLLEVSQRTSKEVFCLMMDFGYRVFIYDNKFIQTENYRNGAFSNYFFFHPQSKVWKRMLPYLYMKAD
jgi:FkbM family methyltransferase